MLHITSFQSESWQISTSSPHNYLNYLFIVISTSSQNGGVLLTAGDDIKPSVPPTWWRNKLTRKDRSGVDALFFQTAREPWYGAKGGRRAIGGLIMWRESATSRRR